jgi:hypothetical protein
MRGETHTGFLEGKPKEKRTLGRPRRTWENNIKMHPQERKEHGLDYSGSG